MRIVPGGPGGILVEQVEAADLQLISAEVLLDVQQSRQADAGHRLRV